MGKVGHLSVNLDFYDSVSFWLLELMNQLLCVDLKTYAKPTYVTQVIIIITTIISVINEASLDRSQNTKFVIGNLKIK